MQTVKREFNAQIFGYPDFDVGLTPSYPLSMYIQIRLLMLLSDVCRYISKSASDVACATLRASTLPGTQHTPRSGIMRLRVHAERNVRLHQHPRRAR